MAGNTRAVLLDTYGGARRLFFLARLPAHANGPRHNRRKTTLWRRFSSSRQRPVTPEDIKPPCRVTFAPRATHYSSHVRCSRPHGHDWSGRCSVGFSGSFLVACAMFDSTGSCRRAAIGLAEYSIQTCTFRRCDRYARLRTTLRQGFGR